MKAVTLILRVLGTWAISWASWAISCAPTAHPVLGGTTPSAPKVLAAGAGPRTADGTAAVTDAKSDEAAEGPMLPAVAMAPPDPPMPRVLLVDELPYATKPAWVAPAAFAPAGAERRGLRPYHPDPRVIVDVRAASDPSAAPALASELQRTARNLGYWPFRHCYEEALRRAPTLAGKVSVDMRISASGHVEHSTPSASTLRDDVVAACVAREALRLSFAPPASAQSEVMTSPVSAKLDVSLAAGDRPLAVRVPVAGAASLRESLRARAPDVERCYAVRAVDNPALGGRLQLRFRVARTGEVIEVSEEGGPFEDPEVTQCVLRTYRSVTLATDASGESLKAPGAPAADRSFVYALHFETAR